MPVQQRDVRSYSKTTPAVPPWWRPLWTLVVLLDARSFLAHAMIRMARIVRGRSRRQGPRLASYRQLPANDNAPPAAGARAARSADELLPGVHDQHLLAPGVLDLLRAYTVWLARREGAAGPANDNDVVRDRYEIPAPPHDVPRAPPDSILARADYRAMGRADNATRYCEMCEPYRVPLDERDTLPEIPSVLRPPPRK